MKQPINIALAFMAFYFIMFQVATASPTESEFIPCQKLATKTLEQCLIENNTHINDECWVDSKTAYAECREKIFFSHMTEIRKANKAAAEERKHKQ